MVEEDGRRELRPLVRDEEPPHESTVVVRGGPTTDRRLEEHASRSNAAYRLDGARLWGVSVFCALDDIGDASLDGLLRRFASYRVVHLPLAGAIREAGFKLLPTFGRPHYTIVLPDIMPSTLHRLLEALGSAQRNPYHGNERRR